ncbi:MAG: amidase [Elusimicrobia bacterium GWA2_69_24]|nr:MAG: amidase [Elusimicrobia bacterium GWA2_69_24]HBL17714.1 amidase [Elusimicrobiota bacterium]
MRFPPLAEAEAPSLRELAEGFRSGKLSPAAHLAALEKRFLEVEPVLQSFVPEYRDRFARLRADLESLEAAAPNPGSRPPLFGVPVGVKDIYNVDGFRTQAGSRLPPDALKGPEAACLRPLRRAGCLILGKTVTTEFAYFAPGPTRNPHDPERTPGGSSSGSAAAVAAGLTPLALGTQTIGSTLRPAAYCGVVGFKPSYGRIPLEGIIPLSPSADHVGIFVRSVEDAGFAASLLIPDWSGSSEPLPRVFGVPEGPYLEKASPETLAHFREVCLRLSAAGMRLRSLDLFPDIAEIVRRHNTLVAAEAAHVHRALFAEFGSLYHEKTADLIRRGQEVDAAELKACRAGRLSLRAALEKRMTEEGISGFLCPSATGPAPAGLAGTGDPVMNLPWTHAGLPCLSLPSGMVGGLPVGLQFVGPFSSDRRLLKTAEGLAEALRARP